MEYALKTVPEHVPEQPTGILSIRVDPLTGRRSAQGDPTGIFEYFMEPYLPEDANPTETELTASPPTTPDGMPNYESAQATPEQLDRSGAGRH